MEGRVLIVLRLISCHNKFNVRREHHIKNLITTSVVCVAYIIIFVKRSFFLFWYFFFIMCVQCLDLKVLSVCWEKIILLLKSNMLSWLIESFPYVNFFQKRKIIGFDNLYSIKYSSDQYVISMSRSCHCYCNVWLNLW